MGVPPTMECLMFAYSLLKACHITLFIAHALQEGTNALLLAIFRKQPQVIRALMACNPNVDLVDEVKL